MKMCKFTKTICIALVIVLIATIAAPLALAANAPSDSIKSVTHTIENGKIIFTVITEAGDFARVRCGFSTSTKDTIKTADTYTVNADGDYVWVLKADAPSADSTYIFDLRSSQTGKYIKDYFYYDVNIIDESDYGLVVDGWYTSRDGAFSIFVDDWYTSEPDWCHHLYDPNSDNFCEVTIGHKSENFENKTIADFREEYYYLDIVSVSKTTIGKAGYTLYYCQADDWEIYEFQTDDWFYRLAFIYREGDREALTKFAARTVDSIILTNDRDSYTIKDIKQETSGNKAIFTVTTKAGNYNRLRCGLSNSTADNLAFTSTYTINADGDYVWKIKTDIPAENTNLVFDLRSGETNKYIKDYSRYNFTLSKSTNADTLVDGWYTCEDGALRLYTGDWQLYNSTNINLADSAQSPTMFCSVKIYDAMDQSAFDSATAEDFKPYIREEISAFTKSATGNADYTMYHIVTEHYEYYAFQANGKLYDIAFFTFGGDRDALSAFAKRAIGSMIITNDAEPDSYIEGVTHKIENGMITFTITTTAGDFSRVRLGLASAPAVSDSIKVASSYTINANGKYEWKITTTAPTAETSYIFDLRSSESGKYLNKPFLYNYSAVIIDGWYTFTDGGTSFKIGNWVYFGRYGITLTQSTEVPCNCLTVAIYQADSDEVFEAKTQADFELVNGESAIEFKKTTVGNAEYTMYYFRSATYENYVFQANGLKYYITFIYYEGGRDAYTEFAAEVMSTIKIKDDIPDWNGPYPCE